MNLLNKFITKELKWPLSKAVTASSIATPPPPTNNLRMNQPIQPPTTLNIPNTTATPSSTKYLDLARKIKEIEMVKKKVKNFLWF